jgi:hypothetical protein
VQLLYRGRITIEKAQVPMKATSKRRLDRLTPLEEKDVEHSLKEIKEGP